MCLQKVIFEVEWRKEGGLHHKECSKFINCEAAQKNGGIVRNFTERTMFSETIFTDEYGAF